MRLHLCAFLTSYELSKEMHMEPLFFADENAPEWAFSKRKGVNFEKPKNLTDKTKLQVLDIPDLSKTYYSLNSITKGLDDTILYEDGLTMVIITDEHEIYILSKMQSHNR